jgi:hypothetical protein
MSEEQKTQSDKSVNQVLTDRLNKAYIAKDYTLLNGGTDNIILIQGEDKDQTECVDILVTYEAIFEALEGFKPQTVK